MVSFGPWDAALIVAVTVQGTAAAYLRHPRWKALMLCFPVPFSLATLAVGAPVGPTHAAGLALLMGYTYGVWLLRARLGWPILAAIATSALGYCAAGVLLARVLAGADQAFWPVIGTVFALALALYVTLPARAEPGHRSPLPVWIKAPLIAAVVVALVALKQALHGFVTAFPMVGLVASYEARHSLWTVWRHLPPIVLSFTPMLIAMRMTQTGAGVGWALAVGWAAYLAALTPLLRRLWAEEEDPKE